MILLSHLNAKRASHFLSGPNRVEQNWTRVLGVQAVDCGVRHNPDHKNTKACCEQPAAACKDKGKWAEANRCRQRQTATHSGVMPNPDWWLDKGGREGFRK